MNLTISALEKVARIGCKYEFSFPLHSLWALPPGGSAEGQLAAIVLVLLVKCGPRGADWGGGAGMSNSTCGDGRQLSQPLQALR